MKEGSETLDDLIVPADDRTLLSECSVTTFRSSGRGGQHVNKTESAVRMRHCPTGIVVTCRKERSQYLNKMTCLKRLRKRLEKLTENPKERIPTQLPKKAKILRKIDKMHRSAIKKMRRTPVSEE